MVHIRTATLSALSTLGKDRPTANKNVNNAHYAYAALFWFFTHRYQDMYNNPIKATNLEHRDVVLDILSDARVVGPLLQTGAFHADVPRRNYMYVFGHNSATGPYANVSTQFQSVYIVYIVDP